MDKKVLSSVEQRRYEKHIMIPSIGEEGQLKLKEARILVVGAGGLGCPALQYLCAAGIGNIGIVEFDVVSNSNLQRQILYGTGDIGKLKSIITRERLIQQNSSVNIEVFNIKLDSSNAEDIIREYDIVVDATDNYETRYVINDTCVAVNKPMIHGAIYKFEAQVAVFNYMQGPTYRCYNPKKETSDNNPLPSEAGLLGVLPGICGTYMANETIKIILGLETVLSGKLLTFNISKNSFYTIDIKTDPKNRKTQ